MRLREIREGIGYKQYQVADYLNVERQTYCRYELGQREPSVEHMIKMCDLFGCSLDELVGRNIDESREIEPRPIPAYPEGIKRNKIPADRDELAKFIADVVEKSFDVSRKGANININTVITNPKNN
jgi:transcriptional regulator with XRE-family HTH domain